LQSPWNLALAIERVDPWIQVNSLQHALVNEAQVKVTANLQYQIENTGLKSFRVYVPTNAESVRFQGDQVADYLKVAGSETNGLQLWEIKLHRRVIGSYLLQATYQVVMPEQRTETVLRGVRATDVNLQRGLSPFSRRAGCRCEWTQRRKRSKTPNGKAFRARSNRTCRMPPPTSLTGWSSRPSNYR
jgi:hypothetical protein